MRKLSIDPQIESVHSEYREINITQKFPASSSGLIFDVKTILLVYLTQFLLGGEGSISYGFFYCLKTISVKEQKFLDFS